MPELKICNFHAIGFPIWMVRKKTFYKNSLTNNKFLKNLFYSFEGCHDSNLLSSQEK